jgi:hypothetical protein
MMQGELWEKRKEKNDMKMQWITLQMGNCSMKMMAFFFLIMWIYA